MSGRSELAPANPVLIAIAVVTMAGSVANTISAVLENEVWGVSARGFSIDRVTHTGAPFSFWVILLSAPAAAAYFIWDIWRRPRSK